MIQLEPPAYQSLATPRCHPRLHIDILTDQSFRSALLIGRHSLDLLRAITEAGPGLAE